MKRSFKKAVTTISLAALALSLSACGGSKPADSASQANSSQPVKLRILWWGSQARHDATTKALDLYTKTHPNVTFTPEYMGFDGYFDKLSTVSAAKNAPDLIQMDPAFLADYASRKQLADLSSGIDTKNIDPSLIDTGKYKDKLYAIALGNNAFGLGFDKASIEKLGLQAPKAGWTWSDYFKLGEDAHAKTGKSALMDFSGYYDMYETYQLAKGKGLVISADGKFNLDKATFLEWQNKFADLRKAGVTPTADVMVTDKELDPKQDLMVAGNVLARPLHAAQASSIDSLKPGAFGLVTTPKDQQAGGWLKASMFWSVSADSKYIEESKKFIDWFVNDPEAGKILGTTRGVPVNKKVLADLTPNFTAADKMGIDLIEKTAPTAQPFVPEPKGWSNFTKKDYKDITQKVMFGKSTPEQAYDELVKKAKEYQQ